MVKTERVELKRGQAETLAAEALDAFWAARLSGQAAVPPVALPLAAELEALASTLQPDAAFVAGLEKRLARKPSALDRHPALVRAGLMAVSLAAAAALIAVLLPCLLPHGGLPRLPALGALNASQDSPYASHGKLPADIRFELDVELPPPLHQVRVFRQKGSAAALTLEDVRLWARRFGMGGPVYSDERAGPGAYVVFDNPYQLMFADSMILYARSLQSASALLSFLPMVQAEPIAEGFLREHGLLDFPYRVEACPGSLGLDQLFCFVHMADGRPVYNVNNLGLPATHAQIVAGVGLDGELEIIAYWPLDLEAGQAYPIRSAQEAWQVLSAGQADHLLMYNSWQVERLSLPARYWTPDYQPGQRADLYGMPEVLWPVEDGGPPLVLINGVLLGASGDDLLALSEWRQGSLGMHVWGQVQQSAPGAISLEVDDWGRSSESHSYAGVVERQDELVLLHDQYCQTFVLPHVPGDVPDRQAVRVVGWEADERTQAGYPVLDWMYIEAQPDSSAPGSETAWPGAPTVYRWSLARLPGWLDSLAGQQAFLEGAYPPSQGVVVFGQPGLAGQQTSAFSARYRVLPGSARQVAIVDAYTVTLVGGQEGVFVRLADAGDRAQPVLAGPKAVVEQVELVYYAVPSIPARTTSASPDPALRVVQPMWRFSGHIGSDQAFEALVQAVRDEYTKPQE